MTQSTPLNSNRSTSGFEETYFTDNFKPSEQYRTDNAGQPYNDGTMSTCHTDQFKPFKKVESKTYNNYYHETDFNSFRRVSCSDYLEKTQDGNTYKVQDGIMVQDKRCLKNSLGTEDNEAAQRKTQCGITSREIGAQKLSRVESEGTEDSIAANTACDKDFVSRRCKTSVLCLYHPEKHLNERIQELEGALQEHGIWLVSKSGSERWDRFAMASLQRFKHIVVIVSDKLTTLCSAVIDRSPINEDLLRERGMELIPCFVMAQMRNNVNCHRPVENSVHLISLSRCRNLGIQTIDTFKRTHTLFSSSPIRCFEYLFNESCVGGHDSFSFLVQRILSE